MNLFKIWFVASIRQWLGRAWHNLHPFMTRTLTITAKHCRKRPRSQGVAVLAILVVVGTATINPVESYSAGRQTVAQIARSLNATATARLHLVRAEGSKLFEEGPVSGAFAGSMRSVLYTGAVFTGSFTTHANGGSITGHGQATPHGSGRYQSFSGTLIVTGGSGRYAHIHGRAGLFGVFDRRTDSVVVQTTGTLTY